jgi:uncharacterized protein (DUF58 family)
MLRLRLANGSAQPRLGIEIDGLGYAPVACTTPATGEVGVDLRIATPQRGLLPIGRLRIMSTWPFGLFRTWTWLHFAHAVTVYPRPAGTGAMPMGGGSRHGTAPRESADIDEWATLRPFRDGDSPRQVAWKAYARGAPLLVKEYTASGSLERVFDFTDLVGLDTEQRLSQLARWIVNCAADGEAFGVRLPQQFIDLDQGMLHRQRCLRALAVFGSEPAIK